MWSKIRHFFRDSETLAFARLQMLAGVVLEVLVQTDPNLIAPIIPSEWFPWYLLASGILTEILRRARADDL